MNLEKRIAALEEELKVLKGEVQQVLLELKEYLLEARYPDLSGFQGNGVHSVAGAVLPHTQHGPSHREDFARNESAQLADVASLARALGTMTVPAPEEANGVEGEDRPLNGKPLNGKRSEQREMDLAALAGWVNTTVRRLGRQPTRQVIELWAHSQGLPEAWSRLLSTLVDMAPEPAETPEPGLEAMASALIELQHITGGR